MAAVVQQNELVFEFASNVMEDEQQVRGRGRDPIRLRGNTRKKKCHVKHQQANAELILVAADLCAVSKASCNLHEPSRNGLKCCNCCSIAETSSENVFLLSLMCASRIHL